MSTHLQDTPSNRSIAIFVGAPRDLTTSGHAQAHAMSTHPKATQSNKSNIDFAAIAESSFQEASLGSSEEQVIGK